MIRTVTVRASQRDPHGANRMSHLEEMGTQFDRAYASEQISLHRKLVAIHAMEDRARQKPP